MTQSAQKSPCPCLGRLCTGIGLFLVLGLAACSLPQAPRTGPAIESLELYPALVRAGRESCTYLDLRLLPEDAHIRRLEVRGIPTAAGAYPAVAYRDRDGRRRYYSRIELPALNEAGRHELNFRLHMADGSVLESSGALNVVESLPVREAPRVLAPEIQGQIDELSGSRVKYGNSVKVLSDGREAFYCWKKALESARARIDIQTYCLDDEGLSGELVEILKHQASSGVEVNLLLTRYSQLGTSPLIPHNLKKHGINVILAGDIGFPHRPDKRSLPWIERMLEDYRIVRTVPDNPAFGEWIRLKGDGALVDYALHEKMLIVDGKLAITGGRNLSDCYFWWWDDLDVLLEGPVVDELARAFDRNWEEFRGPALSPREILSPAANGGAACRLVESRPWQGCYHTLDMLIVALDAAEESICISSQYLALPPRLCKALIRAAGRGVEVRILTNSLETGREVAFSLCHFISLNYYRDLLRAGVHIYEYRPPLKDLKLMPYLHAKEFIIDGAWASIGSFNLSIRSAYLESELMITLHDPELASLRQQTFLDTVMGAATEITFPALALDEDRYGPLMDLARRVEILY